MARRIAEAWGSDYDKENLFPVPTMVENLEEAAEGVHDIQPRRTLRERPYGSQPLMLRPDYKGDFLEQLREERRNKEAADPTNLKDFSDPEEMLKEQEEPYPREMVDDFYQFNTPGMTTRYDVIKDFDDRGWDETDAPEMSEDKVLRMKKIINPRDHGPMHEDIFHSAQTVVAGYLLNVCPLEMDRLYPINISNVRVAFKYLKDLQRSTIQTDAGGVRTPNFNSVSWRLTRAQPRIGRWTYITSSGHTKERLQQHRTLKKVTPFVYTTVFQFIPEESVLDTTKLHVQVSCTCPSFVFYGAQFNAVMDDYLYGPVTPKFAPPRTRDPGRKFLACKHILACIHDVSTRKVEPMEEELREKLRAPRKIKVVQRYPFKKMDEEIRIPKTLKHVWNHPNILGLEKTWDKMSPLKKKTFIMGLEDPEEVAYIAHRFPDNVTTGIVITKLKDMAARERNAQDREEARDLVREISRDTVIKLVPGGEEPQS